MRRFTAQWMRERPWKLLLFGSCERLRSKLQKRKIQEEIGTRPRKKLRTVFAIIPKFSGFAHVAANFGLITDVQSLATSFHNCILSPFNRTNFLRGVQIITHIIRQRHNQRIRLRDGHLTQLLLELRGQHRMLHGDRGKQLRRRRESEGVGRHCRAVGCKVAGDSDGAGRGECRHALCVFEGAPEIEVVQGEGLVGRALHGEGWGAGQAADEAVGGGLGSYAADLDG